VEFENEIGHSRAIEFLSFEAPVETALRRKKTRRGGAARASSASKSLSAAGSCITCGVLSLARAN